MSKYYILINEQKTGPFEESEVIAEYQKGTYTKDTQVCLEGSDDWKPLGSIPAFNIPDALVEEGEVPPAAPKPSVCAKVKAWLQIWKGLAPKTKLIVASAVGVVVALIVAMCVWCGSISSDEDVISYLDKKFNRLKSVDRGTWAGYRNNRRSIILSLDNENSSRDGRRSLASALALTGCKSGIVYIFEKKGFEPDVADTALPNAAISGHLGIVEYLVEEQCSDKQGSKDQAFAAACQCGHVKICRYLVEECEVKVDTDDLERLVKIDLKAYKDAVKNLNGIADAGLDEGELMENVAKVAKFLIEKGAKPSDAKVQEAAKNCPNSKLLDVLSKK